MKFSIKTINYLVYFFLLASAGVLTLSHIPFGVAISMDSLSYINAARKLIQNEGISLPDYGLEHGDVAPLTFWPPLYPIFLATGIPSNHLFDVDVGRSITWLNVLSLFVTLLLFWNIAKTIVPKPLAIFATLLLGLLPSMQIIYLYAWSETLFIPLIVAAFISQLKFFEAAMSDRNKWLCAGVSMLALAFQVRYAAIGVFVGFLISILLLNASSIPDKLILMAKSTGLFLILNAPMMLRNHLVANNLFGSRDQSSALLREDIPTLMHLLGLELFPFPMLFLFPIFLGLMAIVYIVTRPGDRKDIAENQHGKLVFFNGLVWSGAYLAFVVLSRQVYHSDIDTRMVVPAMPLLILSGIALLNCFRNMGYSSIAILSFVVWFGGASIHGYEIHKGILQSWRTTGTPGEIHGITYNSTSNPGFAAFRQLRQIYNLRDDLQILTDLSRPQLIGYFFPTARVKQIPESLSPNNLEIMKRLMNRPGFVLLTTESTVQLFEKSFGKAGSFFQINDPTGKAYPYILMKLPLSESS